MKIVFFGTPKEVVPVLDNLTKHFEVVAVVTAPDKKAGRKQLLKPTPVKIFAAENNIPVIEELKLEDFKQIPQPDIFVVAAYGKILPPEILKLPTYGSINIHPSLLPKYRGSTPIQTTLLNGDKSSGITFIKMDEHMDHGPILHQIPFTLENTDTFDFLMQSKFAQAALILPQVIEDFASGKIKPIPQDDSIATYTKSITKQDGYIDLSDVEKLKPLEIERKIRAYYPWPAVWTKIHLNNPAEGEARQRRRETILKFLPKNKLQVEGKNPVSIKDFLNGYPDQRELLQKLKLA